jgi:hypothetical protein
MAKLILSLQPRTNSKAVRYLHRSAMLAFDPADHHNLSFKMHGRDSPVPRLSFTISQPEVNVDSTGTGRVYDIHLKNKLIRFRDMMRLWGICSSSTDYSYLVIRESTDSVLDYMRYENTQRGGE